MIPSIRSLSTLKFRPFSLESSHERRLIKKPRHHVAEPKLTTGRQRLKTESSHKLDHQKRELGRREAVFSKLASAITK